jgi:hypothetical protein
MLKPVSVEALQKMQEIGLSNIFSSANVGASGGVPNLVCKGSHENAIALLPDS